MAKVLLIVPKMVRQNQLVLRKLSETESNNEFLSFDCVYVCPVCRKFETQVRLISIKDTEDENISFCTCTVKIPLPIH